MNQQSESPLYEHDCSTCSYLGTVHYNGQNYDLYHHGGKRETLIARFGKDGDYTSGMCFAFPFVNAVSGELSTGDPVLVEARRRAEARGLMAKCRSYAEYKEANRDRID